MLRDQAVLVLTLAFAVSIVGTQSVTKLPLNKVTTWADKALYSKFIDIKASSTIQFDFIDVSKNVSFIIFQVHSYIYNVTMYNNTFTEGAYVTGRNIGLYSSVTPKLDVMYLNNPNAVNLTVLVSVYGYREKDPIPGGCNMEFPVSVSPFMRTIYSKDYIFVDASPARYYSDISCTEVNEVSVDFYLMYLPARSYDVDTYFTGLKSMMSMEKINENGFKIPKSAWQMRRMLSAYTGTGTIFVAVAFDTKNPEFYSVYVPTHNYACTPSEDDDDCEILDDILSKFVCASLLFVGIFICYFGHRFFKTEMFLFGMLTGVLITYIIISIMVDIDNAALLSASVLSGLFFGAIWLTFWWFYGIPIIAVTLPALNLGFLLSAIIYNKFPGDVLLIQEDFNFWTLFILVMVLSAMILVFMAFASNILCCAVLGAYAAVYPIDYYVGSNLKYFIINTVRRATVPKFSKAVLLMPFEWRDVLVVVAWVSLAISGFVFQHYHNRGRPPFPPPPRSVRPSRPEPYPVRYGAIPGTSRQEVPSAPTMPTPKGNDADERTRLLSWLDSVQQPL